MSAKYRWTLETTARALGSLVGLVLGVAAVLYCYGDDLAKHRRHPGSSKNENRRAEPRTSQARPKEASPKLDQSSVGLQSSVAESTQHETPLVIASSPPKDKTDEVIRLGVLEFLRHPDTSIAASDPEVIKFAEFSRSELDAEVEEVIDEAAAYISEGTYVPERQAELHRKANALYCVKNLSLKQNSWLSAATRGLNDLAVEHAESVLKSGNATALLDTVRAIGAEWSFRLTEPQRKRLIGTVEKIKN